jgi:ZIP family zinc transporter
MDGNDRMDIIEQILLVELLPEVRRGHDPFEVCWTFAAGVMFMLIIDSAVKRFNHRGTQEAIRGPSPGQLVPIGVDVLLDGILIGIAMTTGLKQALLLTIALTLEWPQNCWCACLRRLELPA